MSKFDIPTLHKFKQTLFANSEGTENYMELSKADAAERDVERLESIKKSYKQKLEAFFRNSVPM